MDIVLSEHVPYRLVSCFPVGTSALPAGPWAVGAERLGGGRRRRPKAESSPSPDVATVNHICQTLPVADGASSPPPSATMSRLHLPQKLVFSGRINCKQVAMSECLLHILSPLRYTVAYMNNVQQMNTVSTPTNRVL